MTQDDVDGALAALDAVAQGGIRRGAWPIRRWPPAGRRSSRRPGRSARRPRPSPPATLVGQEVADLRPRPVGDRHGHQPRTPRRSAAIAEPPAPGGGQAGPPARRRVRSTIDGRRRDRRRPDGQLPGHGVPPKQIAILDPAALEDAGPRQAGRRGAGDPGAVRRGRHLPVSPDWAGSIPTFESRVDLTVEPRRRDRDARRRSSSADAMTRLLGIDLGRAAGRPGAGR